ncbi:MAG: histidine ammonia-lyase [Phycisphaeraceae bacterium]|nr:MAG: histidine ammonia-lyase [Phycisphaeraceae bacterium]
MKKPGAEQSNPASPHDGPLTLSGAPLTVAEVEAVARRVGGVEIGKDAAALLEKSQVGLQAAMSQGRAIYGVNTGFGSLARRRIGEADARNVQINLLRSHASGVGQPLDEELVRAMLLLLAASLCRGRSGVRRELVEALVAMLNAGVTPVVPEIGSVGASGDLAPLAHATLPLIGEGEAYYKGERLPGAEALKRARLTPYELGPKEGIALINGTHLMAAYGALLAADIDRLLSAAACAAAMSIDACKASDSYLDDRVYQARNQPGPARFAATVRTLLRGSEIVPSHRENDPRVQDPYSFRCMAPVIGAALDLLDYARAAIDRELGAVTDNPLVFPDGDAGATVISAGNFHGMPIAMPLDCIALAMTHIAGVSERRTFFALSGTDPESGLTPHLSPEPGLHSGLMITQYAAAACCNELIGLANPASSANISTCAGMEDYNSFGPRAGAKARRAVELTRQVVAIELLCAAEALERQRPLRSGAGVEQAHALVRTVAKKLDKDRPPAPDIAAIAELIREGRFLNIADL